ncbi:hypothetical protein JCM4814A_27770 [Streptomyces phaeofaciens JCM 4814]|uniref:Uncharacterized protein n=1 Tax=Streptomyces phaeofaciens TaxID=68254 RepID=A0A918H4R2_9ACTN|nr:hypothetical protein GCM10010226_13110 [Streptomyces phaeofaciens]
MSMKPVQEATTAAVLKRVGAVSAALGGVGVRCARGRSVTRTPGRTAHDGVGAGGDAPTSVDVTGNIRCVKGAGVM